MSLKINGSTSGSVTLDAPATGSDVSFTLPGSVGTSGQLLSTDGSGVLSFVNGGKILQVVRATDSTQRTTTSTTFVDITGMSVTITPQKSDSAIIVIATFSAYNTATSGAINHSEYALTDNSNNAISGAQAGILYCDHAASKSIQIPNAMLFGYSTPATTAATTYKTRFRTVVANNTAGVANANITGQMFAIEVAA